MVKSLHEVDLLSKSKNYCLMVNQNRPDNEDIDEVFPSIFVSGYSAARNFSLLQNLGVTHVLIVTPYSKEWFP